MPDPAKFRALRKAGLKIQPTCRRCHFWMTNDLQWGTCAKIPYQHEKHTGEERYASTPADGHCDQFSAHEIRVARLGAHQEFFSGD